MEAITDERGESIQTLSELLALSSCDSIMVSDIFYIYGLFEVVRKHQYPSDSAAVKLTTTQEYAS